MADRSGSVEVSGRLLRTSTTAGESCLQRLQRYQIWNKTQYLRCRLFKLYKQRRIQGGGLWGLSPPWKSEGFDFQGGFSPQCPLLRSGQLAQAPLFPLLLFFKGWISNFLNSIFSIIMICILSLCDICKLTKFVISYFFNIKMSKFFQKIHCGT